PRREDGGREADRRRSGRLPKPRLHAADRLGHPRVRAGHARPSPDRPARPGVRGRGAAGRRAGSGMTGDLADRAREIVGAAHLITDQAALASYAVDGVRPAAAAHPGSGEEAARLMTAAGERGAAVLPRGAGVHQHLGGVPARADLVIDTRRLSGITDYVPADYVVAARAGTPFHDLQVELGRHTQWLPLDPPGGGAATIGGL